MSSAPPDIAGCLDNRSLRLILLPTEACNFRCVYCYEDFALGRMRPRVVQGVKRLLSARAPDLDYLTLSWFGGEPLLARDVMEEILQHAAGLVADHPKLTLTSDVTTNGYLLNLPLFERLLDLGVSHYQVSFDGPRAWHDRKRLRADGAGTFDQVWGNLQGIASGRRQFSMIVRVHVDQENHAALPEFLGNYERGFGADGRFRLYVRPLSRFGGPNDAALPVFDESEGKRIAEGLSRAARERGLQEMDLEAMGSVCYAAAGNSFVVRADGRLNKCTLALNHPANQVGRIEEDGSLTIDSPAALRWMRGLQSREPQELECPMLGLADVALPAIAASGARGGLEAVAAPAGA
jgi:uncharacterized protein